MADHGVLRSYRRDPAIKDQKLAPGTTKRILSFARPYKWLLVGFLVVIVGEALLVVAQPLLFKRIIDQGISKGNITVVVVCSLLVALLAIVAAGLSLVERGFSARIGEGLIFDLRTQVFDHVMRQPIAFFTRTQTGALVSRLNSDVIGAQQAFTSTLAGVVNNSVSLVIVLITMFVLSWQITLATLVLVPLFIIPAKFMGRKLQALTREQMGLNADMSQQMTERFNVAGALLVKLFGDPKLEDDLFGGRAGRVRDIGIKIAFQNRTFFVLLTLLASLATALVYGIGGTLVIKGVVTLGTLLAITALLGRLYGPLTSLSNVRVDIMTALVSFERVFEVLDLPPLITELPAAVDLPDEPLEIEFRDVWFRYPRPSEVSLASLESVAIREQVDRGDDPVLKGVSFAVKPGQLVALVGHSGAGKTTMTGLVPRLYDVMEGSVRIGGHDVREVSLDSLHRVVGVVTQDPHMFHDTIRENLLYAAPGATDEEMWNAIEGAQVATLLRSLPNGLDTVVGDRGYRLSGGEKQRLAIARLLLKQPGIVVLDEATAHLDSENEAAVQEALATALLGRTSLVIAHRLSTIRQADLILVVADGRIAEQGTHDELLALSGIYADLYRTQFADQDDAEAAPAIR
jgi:ATP-binding cassette subfamily B protein